jgi:hypothetical protein
VATMTDNHVDLVDNGDCPWPDYPPHMLEYFELCKRNPYLLLLSGWPMHEPVAPKPMTLDEFAKLVGSLRAPQHRQILRELLLDLLGDDLVELVLRMRERGMV